MHHHILARVRGRAWGRRPKDASVALIPKGKFFRCDLKVDLDEIIDHLLYLSASEGIRQPHTSGADSECDGFRLLMVHDVHVAVGALAEHTPPGT